MRTKGFEYICITSELKSNDAKITYSLSRSNIQSELDNGGILQLASLASGGHTLASRSEYGNSIKGQ